MALSTMRISYPPVRFDNPVYSVRSRRVVLKPFEGQPKKWGGVFRLPEGVLELSGIKDVGMGFKLKVNSKKMFEKEAFSASMLGILYQKRMLKF